MVVLYEVAFGENVSADSAGELNTLKLTRKPWRTRILKWMSAHRILLNSFEASSGLREILIVLANHRIFAIKWIALGGNTV